MSTAGETAKCTKCASEIPVEADRCPECGHEPSPGIAGGLIMWVAGSAGLLFGLIAVVSVLLAFSGGLDITSGLIGAVITGGIAAACFAVVWLGYKGSERGPTDDPLFED